MTTLTLAYNFYLTIQSNNESLLACFFNQGYMLYGWYKNVNIQKQGIYYTFKLNHHISLLSD